MDFSLNYIGKYKHEFNKLLDIDLPLCEIYQSSGLCSHIQKRHPNCISYIGNISEIIESPDYIGKNPKEPNSIELVKCYDDNILVAIKLDVRKKYMYVASLYDLTDGKLNRRINSGRLKKIY